MAAKPPLSPPPKYQQSNVTPGPMTLKDWVSFYRWLTSLWQQVKANSGGIIPPPPPVIPPGGEISSALGAAAGRIPTQQPAISREAILREIQGLIPPPAQPAVDQKARDLATIGLGRVIPPFLSPKEILILSQVDYRAAIVAGSLPALIFVYVFDYAHMMFFDGTTPTFAGDWPTKIEGYLTDPGTGWALCDGSGTDYLNADGTVTAVTLPDLTSTSANAAYLKFGSPASLTPNAAIAPTLTMDSYTPAGTITINSYTPTGSISTPTFLGTPASITSAVFTIGAVTALTSFGGSTSSYTPAGLITTPTFTGSPDTLTGSFTGTPAVLTGVISDTAEPRNLILRPYFRR